MESRMPFDDVSWEESENIESAWVKSILEETTLRAIGDFIVKHRQGIPVEMCDPKAGAFNVLFRMKFRDGGSAVIRFPKPGCTMFPEEKIRNEVATIRYIQDNTSIPVPFILHWGTREESPLGLGPFIIMEYINHETDAGKVLNMPELGWQDRPRLNPQVNPDTLDTLYRQLADVLLQLSKLEFPRIGCLEEIADSEWEVRRRPLSIHTNELVRLGTLPRRKLPDSTFANSFEYFEALAQLHSDHLEHQRNDAVDSETDCRRKYIARRLFCKLIKERKVASGAHTNGPFKLWCDDFRPTNVLLDANMQIVGVVDWEFTYAAPAEFCFAPPWWLLLEQPEYWPDGIEDWIEIYEVRLKTFLKAMMDAEERAIASGRLEEDQRLSPKMKASWDSGDFWFIYGARKNFAFDAIFWRELHSRFFEKAEVSPEDAWMTRLDEMDEMEKTDMEEFVERKMKSMGTRVLAWEPDE
ncbi:hypothetical protein C2857_007860 [Epichloe festucae Fl1]|uniref:Aminoglycoside phosphotransferase domain-containing protein n=1 Tax=Epichloe festucae (strain Fl1) TaxID=877507 RepID=A0A7S9KR20_EPIFF|nr:hypothetical protein C2857_007860 [Epichloe festucae Fl1]